MLASGAEPKSISRGEDTLWGLDHRRLLGKANTASNPSALPRAGEKNYSFPRLTHDLINNSKAKTNPRRGLRACTLEAALRLCQVLGADNRTGIDDANTGAGTDQDFDLRVGGTVSEPIVDEVL